MSTSLEIVRIPVLSDNYVWLMREPQSGCVGVVDPAVAGPVLAEAEKRRWKITHILNTHHHGDHVGGNMEIKQATGCTIVGPRRDRARIPGIEVAAAHFHDHSAYADWVLRGGPAHFAPAMTSHVEPFDYLYAVAVLFSHGGEVPYPGDAIRQLLDRS